MIEPLDDSTETAADKTSMIVESVPEPLAGASGSSRQQGQRIAVAGRTAGWPSRRIRRPRGPVIGRSMRPGRGAWIARVFTEAGRPAII
jgi:hypothetical protein